MNPQTEFKIPRKWGTLHPKFLIGMVASLLAIGVVAGYVEFTQSRKEILALKRVEAESLFDAITLSSEGAAVAYGEIEALVEKQLHDAAQFLIQQDAERTLTLPVFRSFLRTNEIDHAMFVNEDGRQAGLNYLNYSKPLRENNRPDEKRSNKTPTQLEFDEDELAQFVEQLHLTERDFVSGFIQDRNGNAHYAVAMPRFVDNSTAAHKPASWGALVLGVHSQTLLNYRNRLGIGRLIRNLGSNREIAYIALQDTQGIIAATGNVKSLSRISNDPFLTSSLDSDVTQSRIVDFADREVFEVVKPFTVSGERFGLLRVGLSMAAANQAIARTRQRGLLVGLGFVVIVVILFNFMVSNQNYRLLTDAYARIQTYTGNILQNMADAVVAVNREGRITVFNHGAEWLFGIPSQDAVGKGCADILHGQTSLLDQSLESGKGVTDIEIKHQVGDKVITLTVTTTVIRNAGGQVDSAVAVLKDFTEKKALEENLRRREKLSAMGELASGVAHEIRNPLNSISMIAQRFAREFSPAERRDKFKQLAQAIVSETRRVSDIIRRFLAFARPPKLNLEMSGLNEVAQRSLALVTSEANQQGVAIYHELDHDLPSILLDRNQMEQVLLNLLQNSLHACVSGGKVILRTYRSGQNIVAEIIDTGHGIPKENLNKVFDLHFTTKETGTGMGLSIVQRIVSEHGGRVEVESEEGKGTEVALVFGVDADYRVDAD